MRNHDFTIANTRHGEKDGNGNMTQPAPSESVNARPKYQAPSRTRLTHQDTEAGGSFIADGGITDMGS